MNLTEKSMFSIFMCLYFFMFQHSLLLKSDFLATDILGHFV